MTKLEVWHKFSKNYCDERDGCIGCKWHKEAEGCQHPDFCSKFEDDAEEEYYVDPLLLKLLTY